MKTLPASRLHFRLKLSQGETKQRARLLNRTARVLLVAGIAAGILVLIAPIEKLPSADWLSVIFILITLGLTALCTFQSERQARHHSAALCFIVGFSLAVSIAVWQFGKRVPEVHLAYFIPVALAAILWGTLPGIVVALSIWIANVSVVVLQPAGKPMVLGFTDVIGLLTLGASYLALAIVVGRFSASLADAARLAEDRAQAASEAEKQAHIYADNLAVSLRAEQARRKELGTLYSLASRLAATSKPEQFLPFTAESVVNTLNITFAIVALIEKDQTDDAPSLRVVECHPCRQIATETTIGTVARLSVLPNIQRALESRECIILQSVVQSDLVPAESKFLNSARASSVAIVPMFVADKPLGIFALGEARTWAREPLGEEKMQLARSIADLTAGAIQRSRLFAELEDAYVQTVLALARAVEAKDTYTADHADRLASLAERVAEKLGFNDASELQALRFGAMLHDVGKIGVPDSVLKKPGRLDEEEWKQMRQHPAIGSRILDSVARLRDAAKVVRHHHERWDGNGYPDRLKGDSIPLGARILTVVDAYSAIVDQRVYKTARSQDEAIAELKRAAGSQFDPRIVEVFLQVLDEEELLSKVAVPPADQVFEELAARASMQQLEALTRLVSALGGSFDLTSILQQSTKTVVEILGAAATGLFLCDHETDSLEIAADYGLPDELKARFGKFPVVGFHNEAVVRENRPRLHGAPSDVPEFVNLGLPRLKPEWGNYLCVPLSADGEVKGVMGIFSYGVRPFDQYEVSVYRWLGEQIGRAIANARLHESVQLQALTDGLTGVYNRRYLNQFLSVELKRCVRYQHGISVIMLDIDSFKDYNDAYGHLEGDKALKELTRVISGHLRSIDVLARYGGEEFIVVLPETPIEGAMAVAEKIRDAVEKYEFPCGSLNISLGVASCAQISTESPEDLLALADGGLYQAKRNGRNRVGLGETKAESVFG